RLTEETHIQADCFGQLHEPCLIQPQAPINRLFDSALGAFIEVLDQHTLQDLVAARPRTSRMHGESAARADFAEITAGRG
ncbi:MAG TPA: hypothetical protein VGA77_17450, partial [Propylenella sp.]